jgi:ADP-ribose pyrophosphatase YjhB (NUDIX family)
MTSRRFGLEETTNNSFLWLAPFAPAKGCTNVPRGGMCLCAFLFVVNGERILLGKYAEHPAWERLTGMDSKRVEAHSGGWTLPASHLKFGEDPRDAARRIGEDILMINKGLDYSEPHVETFFYEPAIAPGEKHFDVIFLFEVLVGADIRIRKPPWYEALEWHDAKAMRREQFARQHEDVVEVWLKARAGRM